MPSSKLQQCVQLGWELNLDHMVALKRFFNPFSQLQLSQSKSVWSGYLFNNFSKH